MGNSLLIIQLADDTALFLKDSDQIPNTLKAVSSFSDASELYLSLRKCEILTIHDNQQMHNIPVKNEVK